MKKNVFEQSILLDSRIATKAAQLIPVSSTHVIVSQNLLPHLYATGALGGRSFDVLMTRLPMDKLHERLDAAYANYPHSSTLSDFRAPEKLIEIENKALTRARRIITPHADIASLYKNKVVKLEWTVPVLKAKVNNEGQILFPASSLGRKGAYEMRRLARELNLSFAVAGNAIEEEGFWEGMKVEKCYTGLEDIRLVIYPTYIEHQPRKLLHAIAKGIPVITTKASGLESSERVIVVEIGDYDALKKAVKEELACSIPVGTGRDLSLLR
jgi:hypothetical protein